MSNKLYFFASRRVFFSAATAFIVLFSFWLMFHTFSYSDGSMYIASKAWSDFSGNIPLIRSFSYGDNIPPQYPLFSGEPIRYHFLFYAFVGFLERLGVRIDYALNIPSSLGFAGLLLVVYIFAKTLFKSRMVGIVSVVFFLFNGSFSFLEFFKDHSLSIHTLKEIISNTVFPSFAPYGKGIVSAFWSLNIYTNQRHLAIAYGFSLLTLLLLLLPILKNKKPSLAHATYIGIALGVSFFFHMAVFLMTVLVIGGMFLLFPKLRISSLIVIFIAGLLALPQYLTVWQSGTISSLSFYPGYLSGPQVTVNTLFSYWFANLGLHTIGMILGFLLAHHNAKKLFLCFIPVFLIGNLVQFSVEIAANHKFFNFFMIVGVMFSAYFLVYLWKKTTKIRPFVVIIVFFLTLSGFIDFFPIYNDGKLTLSDYPKNPDVAWIIDNTPKDAIVLNSSYLYHPASLAGRKIFLGWPYFPWSQGYDTNKRGQEFNKIYSFSTKEEVCLGLQKNSIDYITVENTNNDPNLPHIDVNFFQKNFKESYKNEQRGFFIFETQSNCFR